MRFNRRLVTLVVAGLFASVAVSEIAPAQAVGRYVHPNTMASLAGSDQVVVVQANNNSSTWAWLSAWERRSNGWVLVHGPVAARLGSTGLSNRPIGDRRQNDGSTPTGVYSFGLAFGSGSDPGTDLRYRRFDSSDYWTYDPRDPKTYNILQVTRAKAAKWRLGWAERLASYGKQYEFGAVINFNVPRGVYYSKSQYITKTPANTKRGGGIFLHVNGKGATAGCVSVPRNDMRWILRWLDPTEKPRIAIGTPSQLNSF